MRSSSSAERGRLPSARCEPMDPRRRVVSTGRGSRSRASACRCAPVALPSSRSAVAASSSASWPTVRMPSRCSFSAVTAPTPQSRSTGSGSRNACSRSGSTTSSPSGLLTALATFARNLVRATPTEIASPTSSAHPLAQSHRDLLGRARDAAEPADLQERLVDGEPLDERRRVAEDREHVAAGRGVGIHPRRDDHGIRAQLARLPAAHRRAHPAGLRLVARGEHHAAAHDHRPSAQRGRVALLDRGVERVEVGVQHGRLAPHPALPPIARRADRPTHRGHAGRGPPRPARRGRCEPAAARGWAVFSRRDGRVLRGGDDDVRDDPGLREEQGVAGRDVGDLRADARGHVLQHRLVERVVLRADDRPARLVVPGGVLHLGVRRPTC